MNDALLPRNVLVKDQWPGAGQRMLNFPLLLGATIVLENIYQVTYPCSNLALPKPALLPDLVRASKLFHVLAEVTLSTVLRSSAGLTFPTHAHWTLHLHKNLKKNKPQSVTTAHMGCNFMQPMWLNASSFSVPALCNSWHIYSDYCESGTSNF